MSYVTSFYLVTKWFIIGVGIIAAINYIRRVTEVSIRDQVVAAEDIESEIVEVPQWGVKIEVRGMTGKERARMLKSCSDPMTGQVDIEKISPDVIIGCSWDPDTGEKVFLPGDRDMLLSKSGAALEKIALAGMRLSGLTPEAAKAAGEE